MVTRRSKKTKPDKQKPKRHSVTRKDYVLSDRPLQIFRPSRLAKLLDVNPVTIWRWWKEDGVLPPPTQIGPYIRGWTRDQVAHLLRGRNE
jgi:hypothetical protein